MPTTDLATIASFAMQSCESGLTVRYVKLEGRHRSLICTGPLGAVELRVLPGDVMSLEFHSRQQDIPGETPVEDYWVLDGDCWPGGSSIGVREKFEPLLRAGDASAVLAALAASYRANRWTCSPR